MSLTGSLASLPSTVGSKRKRTDNHETFIREQLELQKQGVEQQTLLATGLTGLVKRIQSSIVGQMHPRFTLSVRENEDALTLFDQLCKARQNVREAQECSGRDIERRALRILRMVELDLDGLDQDEGDTDSADPVYTQPSTSGRN